MGKKVKSIPKINQDDFESEKLVDHKGKSVVIFSAAPRAGAAVEGF